jgi:hypothetical protein
MSKALRLAGASVLVLFASCTHRPAPPSAGAPGKGEEYEPGAVSTRERAATGARITARSSPPCQPDLASCAPDGCEEPGTPHALFNDLKRRTTAADGSAITFASATPITFDTLATLQSKANDAIGQEVMPADRSALASIDADGVTLGEGAPVRLVGYLAPHVSEYAGTHPGGVESVNCRLTREEWRDIHIPLLPRPDADECSGVVVEMIPQGRDQNAGWTKENLWAIQQQGGLVLVVGPLFYDSEHAVNDDCSNLKAGQPKRMSLWEVHPIIELYSCAGQSCTADSLDGWQRIGGPR